MKRGRRGGGGPPAHCPSSSRSSFRDVTFPSAQCHQGPRWGGGGGVAEGAAVQRDQQGKGGRGLIVSVTTLHIPYYLPLISHQLITHDRYPSSIMST